MKKGGSLKLGDSGAVLTGLDIILLETENRTRRYDVQLSMCPDGIKDQCFWRV